MIPFKSPLLLTVPPTLEKRLEALAALPTLLAQDEELVRQRRAAIAAVRRDIEELRREVAAIRPRLVAQVRSDVLRMLKYNPDEPRVPAGQSGGGQWTKDGESIAGPHVAQLFPTPPLFEQPPLFFARPPFAEFPKDPKLPPGPGYEWRGAPGSQPGDRYGNWHNPKTDESLHPDMDHRPPIGPHWDYYTPDGEKYRRFPDGRFELDS
jgi:hypothetical protein